MPTPLERIVHRGDEVHPADEIVVLDAYCVSRLEQHVGDLLGHLRARTAPADEIIDLEALRSVHSAAARAGLRIISLRLAALDHRPKPAFN